MRILKLTAATEKTAARAANFADADAERVVAKIVADVRKRGDVGTFRLDRRNSISFDLAHKDALDLSKSEICIAAERTVSSELLAAPSRHAARKYSRASPRNSFPAHGRSTSNPACAIRQIVSPIESIGCYIPGGRRVARLDTVDDGRFPHKSPA